MANDLKTSGAGQHHEDSTTTLSAAEAAVKWVYRSPKGNAITDTLRVAQFFGKRPGNVMRRVRAIITHLPTSQGELTNEPAAIFHPWHYLDEKGNKHVLFLLNRAAFTLLVMGFTGKQATNFKLQYIEQFDRMEAKLQGRSPLLPPLPLANLTKREVQVSCTKQVATHLLGSRAGMNGLIQHHRSVMRCLVGMTPTEYVRAAVASGLRVGSYSGRELLRRLSPGKAATAAFLDDQLRRGKSLEQLKAAQLHELLPQVFTQMLACGILPAELLADTNDGKGQNG